MIKLTRLNGAEFCLNSDLIETVEATPDTVVTLTTNRKVVILESVDEVINRVKEFRREIGIGQCREVGVEDGRRREE